MYILTCHVQKRESVNSFILTNINTFTCKITGIISFNIERQWHLKDIAELIYTSESLIKRLRDEGTSFTEILRDTRMRYAKTHNFKLLFYQCRSPEMWL